MAKKICGKPSIGDPPHASLRISELFSSQTSIVFQYVTEGGARRIARIAALALCSLRAAAAEPIEECGRVLPIFYGDRIAVACPQLDKLDVEETWQLIVRTLNYASAHPGDMRIFFFSTEPLSNEKFGWAEEEAMIASWGNLLIGHYHTRNGILSIRTGGDQWREVRMPPNTNGGSS